MPIEHKYNLAKFAKELGISRKTLYRWINGKVIEPPKETPSGKKYYTNEDLAKYSDLVIIDNRSTTESD